MSTVPKRPADITPALLRRLTGRRDITAVRVDSEDHGTALRARLRLVGDPGLPPTAFAKLTPVKPAERLFNRLMGLGATEAAVYRLLGADLAGIAPAAYGMAADPRSGRSLILLEDLDARGARFGDWVAGCTADDAAAVVAALAQLHRTFWATARFGTDLAGFTAPASRTLRFGPHTWRLLRLVPRRYRDIVPEEVRTQALVLQRHRRAAAAALRRGPLTLLHGDTHLGNVAFVDGAPVLFDWQVASAGPGIKDVAYFLATSLDPDVRRSAERDLVKLYRQRLGADIPAAHMWDAYRLQAATAYIAAAVTASFSGRLQGETATRAGLSRAVAAVTDLGSLEVLSRSL